MEVCECYRTLDLEKKLGIKKEQIRDNKRQFLRIKFTDSITRRNKSGCGYRYIEFSELVKFIPKDLILTRANLIGEKSETLSKEGE